MPQMSQIFYCNLPSLEPLLSSGTSVRESMGGRLNWLLLRKRTFSKPFKFTLQFSLPDNIEGHLSGCTNYSSRQPLSCISECCLDSRHPVSYVSVFLTVQFFSLCPLCFECPLFSFVSFLDEFICWIPVMCWFRPGFQDTVMLKADAETYCGAVTLLNLNSLSLHCSSSQVFSALHLMVILIIK